MENELPEIGYLYHYPRLDRKTENFRLDIFVSSTPTEKHFDVQHAYFFVKKEKGAMEKLIVIHPWTYKKNEQVCAGVVIMEDRNKEKKEAFSFGGELSIETRKAQSICVLTSPAPILNISDATPTQKFFIEELEILFAERRAAFQNHLVFERKFSNADPLHLYLASLKALIQKFEEMPHKDSQYRHFLHFLHEEKYRLYEARISVDLAPTLDEIFVISQ